MYVSIVGPSALDAAGNVSDEVQRQIEFERVVWSDNASFKGKVD